MCLAVPMKLIDVRPDGHGTAELEGTRYEVNLSLIDTPGVGDFVIVHAGFAIERLDLAEADERLQLFADLARHHKTTAPSGTPDRHD